jgi:hypothetical protein
MSYDFTVNRMIDASVRRTVMIRAESSLYAAAGANDGSLTTYKMHTYAQAWRDLLSHRHGY